MNASVIVRRLSLLVERYMYFPIAKVFIGILNTNEYIDESKILSRIWDRGLRNIYQIQIIN